MMPTASLPTPCLENLDSSGINDFQGHWGYGAANGEAGDTALGDGPRSPILHRIPRRPSATLISRVRAALKPLPDNVTYAG
jgi:hypothetical protein